MQQFNPQLIKLPSTISRHLDFIRYVSACFSGSVAISTGMTDITYEDFVLRHLTLCDKLYLLQCNSAYPTASQHCNIAVVQHYRDLSNVDPRIIPGYSSHDLGWLASALAVAAGACMVEKHVRAGTSEWADFNDVALDLETGDFGDYVSHIREAEIMMGSGVKSVNVSEHHKYMPRDASGSDYCASSCVRTNQA